MMESTAYSYYVTKLLAGEGIGKIEESGAKIRNSRCCYFFPFCIHPAVKPAYTTPPQH